jgi:hypothetical protein
MIAVSREAPDANEIEAIFARLRSEVRTGPPTRFPEDGAEAAGLRTRRQLDRLWQVSADRPFLSRPGTWGRVRGALALPAKFALRKLMRWYVEPVAADQRAFNAAMLRALDEHAAWVRREIERLEREARGE